MPETCVTFGKFGARVMVEDQEVQHYAMHIDPVKKEVSCWIASEAGKVRELLDTWILLLLLTSMTPLFSEIFRRLAGTRDRLPTSR